MTAARAMATPTARMMPRMMTARQGRRPGRDHYLWGTYADVRSRRQQHAAASRSGVSSGRTLQARCRGSLDQCVHGTAAAARNDSDGNGDSQLETHFNTSQGIAMATPGSPVLPGQVMCRPCRAADARAALWPLSCPLAAHSGRASGKFPAVINVRPPPSPAAASAVQRSAVPGNALDQHAFPRAPAWSRWVLHQQARAQASVLLSWRTWPREPSVVSARGTRTEDVPCLRL